MFPRMLQGCLSLQGTPDLVRAVGEASISKFWSFQLLVEYVRSLPEADNIWQKSWMCSRRVLVKMEVMVTGYCVVVFRFVLVFCHLFYPAGGLALPTSPSLKLPRAAQKLSRNWTHQIFLTPDHCIQFSPNFISTLSAPSQCFQHVRYLVPSSGDPSPPRPDRYAGLGISVAFATPSGFSMD